MRHLACSAMPLARLTSSCAADLWDRRVYDCDEIDLIAVDHSVLELESDSDDCYVQVENLREHELDDGVLSGTDLTIRVSQSVAYDVTDSEVQHDVAGLGFDIELGDVRWLPDEERLDITGTNSVYVEGKVRRVVLDDAGLASIDADPGFEVLEGTGQEIFLDTRSGDLRSINIEADGQIELTLPRNEAYLLELDAADDLSIDLGIRQVEVDPTVTLSATSLRDDILL